MNKSYNTNLVGNVFLDFFMPNCFSIKAFKEQKNQFFFILRLNGCRYAKMLKHIAPELGVGHSDETKNV